MVMLEKVIVLSRLRSQQRKQQRQQFRQQQATAEDRCWQATLLCDCKLAVQYTVHLFLCSLVLCSRSQIFPSLAITVLQSISQIAGLEGAHILYLHLVWILLIDVLLQIDYRIHYMFWWVQHSLTRWFISRCPGAFDLLTLINISIFWPFILPFWLKSWEYL